VGSSIFGNLNAKNPPADLIKAVADGKVDVAVAWGPLAGFFMRHSPVPLEITPVAGGRVAPDLTHIGSREYIASDMYRNNDAYLEAWVTHAQSLKPEAEMPNLTQFSGEQLHDLVAYLRQLQ
jgi:Cytochrome c